MPQVTLPVPQRFPLITLRIILDKNGNSFGNYSSCIRNEK